jgi:integrase
MSSKVQLTDAVVARFKCPEGTKQAFLWDKQMQGLGVRALPDHMRNGAVMPGAKMWIVQGRIAGAGKERRVTLGAVSMVRLNPRDAKDDEAEDEAKLSARELARRARRLMALGRDPIEEAAQKVAAKDASAEREKLEAVTLRQVADHYIANKKTRNGPLKANTIRDINSHVDKAFATWADKPVKAITRRMCEERHAELASHGLTGERPAPVRAAQAFIVLRALLNWAADKYRVNDEPLLRENPVLVLKGQMAPPKARTTKVPAGRVGHVWEALQRLRADQAQLPATHTQADALSFMLLTGGRTSEVLGLTWDRVHLDEDAGSWHLPDPKNSNPVTFPLSAAARALLAARKRKPGGNFVFPARTGKGHASIPRGPAMRAAIDAAGCPLDRHALRRTFTTVAITVLGIELWKAELLTNHMRAGNVTLDHYTERNDLRYLAPEAERVGKYIEEQAAIAAGRNVVKLPEKKRA